MKIKRLLLLLPLLILLFMITYSLGNVIYDGVKMKRDVKDYLFNVKHYTEADINDISYNYLTRMMKGFNMTSVVFSDEPEFLYTYSYMIINDRVQIRQSGGNSLDGKHEEPMDYYYK